MRYQDPVLWVWLEMFFTPLEVPILKPHIISFHIFLKLKGTANAPSMNLLRSTELNLPVDLPLWTS